MPSRAYDQTFFRVLNDVNDLIGAHEAGRTGAAGRQWKLAGLNRSIVVMSVAAWQSYVEAVVMEGLDLLRPNEGVASGWNSQRAIAGSAKGRFSTPNYENTKKLFQEGLGIEDVSLGWSWQRTTQRQARDRLNRYLKLRHSIAHGEYPVASVSHSDAKRISIFFRILAEKTDVELNRMFWKIFGIDTGWYEGAA